MQIIKTPPPTADNKENNNRTLYVSFSCITHVGRNKQDAISGVARVGGGGRLASHNPIKPPVWARRVVAKFV